MDEQKSLKRIHDAGDGPTKKKNRDHHESEHVTFKILIPNIAVGAIIGKGGESMRTLKNEFHCQLTMSKTGGLYPGTNERILTIKGGIANAGRVLRAIQDKVYEKLRDLSVQMYETDGFDFKDTNRGTEIKIVMPNTSAGLVIGKQGSSIKEIRETHQVLIQVHPKAGTIEAKNSAERVVVIATDNMDNLIAAAEQVLQKVASDPQHNEAMNRELSGREPGRPMTPPYQQYPGTPNQSMGYGYQPSFTPMEARSLIRAPAQSMQPYLPPMPTTVELMPFLDQLKVVLRESGFKETAIGEIMTALNILAKYNIMALGLGFGSMAMAQLPPQHNTAHQMQMGSQMYSAEYQPYQGGWKR